MSSMSGVLQEIQARKLASGKTAYDLIVGGKKYGYGLYPPKANVGDYVTFEIDASRGYENVARNSLKASEYKGEQSSPARPAVPAASTNSYADRQDTISRQAASNTALEFIQLLERQDALPVPASAKNKAAKEQALATLVKKYTAEFYEFNTGIKFKDISPGGSESSDSSDDEMPEDEEWN